MAGLVPAIYVFDALKSDVDARVKTFVRQENLIHSDRATR
jgi:hypothetical protein